MTMHFFSYFSLFCAYLCIFIAYFSIRMHIMHIPVLQVINTVPFGFHSGSASQFIACKHSHSRSSGNPRARTGPRSGGRYISVCSPWFLIWLEIFQLEFFCLVFRSPSVDPFLCLWRYVQFDLICNCQLLSVCWHYWFFRRKIMCQPTIASNSDVSTKSLYCANLNRPKPSLSRLHHKQRKGQAVRAGWILRVSDPESSSSQASLPVVCSQYQLSKLQEEKRQRPRLPLRLLPPIRCISEAPRRCTRGATRRA